LTKKQVDYIFKLNVEKYLALLKIKRAFLYSGDDDERKKFQ